MLSARAWCMVMAARVAPPATPTIALQKLLRVLALDQIPAKSMWTYVGRSGVAAYPAHASAKK
jgi:hypothetical protein